MRTIIGYGFASLFFLTFIAFGVALAIAPIHATVKSWHQRSELENTSRVVLAALGLFVGLRIVLGAIEMGVVFPPHW